MSDVDDEALWKSYARGVKKLGEKEPEPEPTKKTVATAVPQAPEQKTKEEDAPAFAELMGREKPPSAPPHRSVTIAPPPSKTEAQAPVPTPPKAWKKEPLDLRVERNMSLGDVMIEARLDLHGQTESTAHDAFKAFVETNYARGRRMLLVITGKGADGASVLRSNLPRWCDVPPFDNYVMAVRTAAQHHGGEGAYYVLLRKRGS